MELPSRPITLADLVRSAARPPRSGEVEKVRVEAPNIARCGRCGASLDPEVRAPACRRCAPRHRRDKISPRREPQSANEDKKQKPHGH